MRLEGEVNVEEGSRASVPALGIGVDVVDGFSVAFQTSLSSGEWFVSLSPQLSGD